VVEDAAWSSQSMAPGLEESERLVLVRRGDLQFTVHTSRKNDILFDHFIGVPFSIGDGGQRTVASPLQLIHFFLEYVATTIPRDCLAARTDLVPPSTGTVSLISS
jgi:hypothetical protein